MSTIRLELSASSVRRVKEELSRYIDSLPTRCEELCKRLAEVGVEAAKANVPIDTGNLMSGISMQRIGDADYLVVSVGEYAAFVEFGTGVVGSGTYDGQLPPEWGYDLRRTPGAHDPDDPTAWYYYDDDGVLHRTRGQQASSYMTKSAEQMRQQVLEIAKEVFAYERR